MTKVVDLANDEIRIALMNNSHAFNGAHNVWSDVSANEISGAGYVAGGEVLANKTVEQGAITKWDGDNVRWEDASVEFYHGVLRDVTAGDSLIASLDFGGAQSLTDGILEIQWSVDGIISLSE